MENVLNPYLLKATEVARILNISRAMAYLLMQRGEIRTVRISSAVRVRREDLDQYIQDNLSPICPNNMSQRSINSLHQDV
ncbi:MAG TPA: helix-turn-helix domain-containing protein [Anaerolineaceae bacterium]